MRRSSSSVASKQGRRASFDLDFCRIEAKHSVSRMSLRTGRPARGPRRIRRSTCKPADCVRDSPGPCSELAVTTAALSEQTLLSASPWPGVVRCALAIRVHCSPDPRQGEATATMRRKRVEMALSIVAVTLEVPQASILVGCRQGLAHTDPQYPFSISNPIISDL